MLNTAIIQDGSNIVTERSEFPIIHTKIENTFFYNINTDKYGAAISSFGPLHLINCKFSELIAENVGAIQVFNECFLKQCTFSDVTANDRIAILEQKSPKDPIDLDINLTNSFKTSAKYFGGFFKTSHGIHRTFDCNFSNTNVKECVGFSEIKYGEVNTKNVLFHKISAGVHNGCNIYKECKQTSFKNTNFIDVKQHSYIADTATCIVFYQPGYNINLTNCVFLDLSPEEQTIYCGTNVKITFTNCRFQKSQLIALKVLNSELINTVFSNSTRLEIKKDEKIGYHKNLSFWSFMPNFAFSGIIFFYSLVISLLTASLFTLLHMIINKTRHQHKAIKAFV